MGVQKVTEQSMLYKKLNNRTVAQLGRELYTVEDNKFCSCQFCKKHNYIELYLKICFSIQQWMIESKCCLKDFAKGTHDAFKNRHIPV